MQEKEVRASLLPFHRLRHDHNPRFLGLCRSGWKLLRDAHEIQVLATAKTVDAKWGALLKRNLRKYDKAAIRVPSYMQKLEQARQEKEELDKRLAANENLLDARAHRLLSDLQFLVARVVGGLMQKQKENSAQSPRSLNDLVRLSEWVHLPPNPPSFCLLLKALHLPL